VFEFLIAPLKSPEHTRVGYSDFVNYEIMGQLMVYERTDAEIEFSRHDFHDN